MSTKPITESRVDIEVRELVYTRLLAEARTTSKEEIAKWLSLSIEDVDTSLRRLAEAHMIVLQPRSGEILMANPFSAVPTQFVVRAGVKEWWGNCIWDALGILAMVDQDGSIHTSCQDCGEDLRLEVAGGKMLPEQSIVHFAVPAAHWWEDIVFT